MKVFKGSVKRLEKDNSILIAQSLLVTANTMDEALGKIRSACAALSNISYNDIDVYSMTVVVDEYEV